MMKRFTLFLLLAAFAWTGWSQATLLDVSLTDDPNFPAGWTVIDNDGLPLSPFYASQNLPSEWSIRNFGPPTLVAAYSVSEYDGGGTADDWLITDQISLGSLSMELTFEFAGFNTAPQMEVLITESIAGATPAVSDFSTSLGVFNVTPAGVGDWEQSGPISLDAHASQDVYIAFRNITTDPTPSAEGATIIALRNIKILEYYPDDARVDEVVFVNAGDVRTTDYLITNVDYQVFSCQPGAAEAVSITLTNVGSNPITSFDASYAIDIDLGGIPVTETVTPATPIAAGETYTHVFASTADVQTSGDPYYRLDGWVDTPADTVRGNDTVIVDIVITPSGPHDFSASGDFFSDFEQVETGLAGLADDWAWTYEDANNDGVSFYITTDVFLQGGVDPYSGSMAMQYSWNPDGATAANDWAFTPCLDLKEGEGYLITLQAQVGEENGVVFPERFELALGTSPSSSSMTVFNDIGEIDNTTWEEYTATFAVPSDGSYHVGIHCYSAADQWHLDLEDFRITSFDPTVSASFITNADAGVLRNCGELTAYSTSSGIIDSYEWDYGDGNTATGPNPDPHTYISFGTYDVQLIVSNALSSDTITQTIEYQAELAPVASLLSIESNGETQTDFTGLVVVDNCDGDVTFVADGASYPQNTTYNWDFDGDNNTDATGTAVTHDFGSLYEGTSVVTLEVLNCEGLSDNVSFNLSVEKPTPEPGFITIINGLEVTFSNTTTPGDCDGYTYSWIFGDGSPAFPGFGPVAHTYLSAGTYTVVLSVTGPGGGTPELYTEQITLVSSTNINELELASGINLYPTPVTNGVLNVAFELSNSEDVTLSIFSFDGKEIASVQRENALSVNEAFNVSMIENGMYILRVETENGITTRRFAVNNR